MRNKILRACEMLTAAVARFQKRIGQIFLSRREIDRRAAGSALDRERKTTEDERLDRLRNPGRYRGR
jgi:hypothetical protein